MKNVSNWIVAGLEGSGKAVRGIDGIRALCVLIVASDHADLLNRYLAGAMGVWIFFVISGFLIVPALMRAAERVHAGRTRLSREMLIFFQHRALRIYPIYFLVLALIGTVAILGVQSQGATLFAKAWPWFVLPAANAYIGNVLKAWPAGISHFWSLAIEQQFYLFFPLLMLPLPPRLWKPALYAMIGLFSLLAVLMIDPTFTPSFYVSSFSGYVSILIGGLFGILAREGAGHPPGKGTNAVVLMSALAMVVAHLALVLSGWQNVSLYVVSVLTGLILHRISRDQASDAVSVLEWRPLRWLGVVSYGFYIYHLLFVPAIRATLHGALGSGLATLVPVLTFAVDVAVSFLVALISYLVIERPFLHLKQRVEA